jgi:hypothetical protein
VNLDPALRYTTLDSVTGTSWDINKFPTERERFDTRNEFILVIDEESPDFMKVLPSVDRALSARNPETLVSDAFDLT